MSAKNRGEGDKGLIGKIATIIQGGIRSENEWTGVKITDVTSEAVTCEWTSRNVHYTDVIPWHSITQISVRFSNNEMAASEPKTI
jgi:hypothetical protein